MFRHDPSAEMKAFEVASREFSFSIGEGFLGRVWRDNKALWLTDLACETNFSRAIFAAQAGLKSTVAFPIMVGSEFLGVIEFFSRKAKEADPKLVEVTADLGTRIGAFILRNRAENDRRKFYEEIENRVAMRTSELRLANDALKKSESDVARQVERLRSVVDHVVDGIITINEHYLIETWNPAAQKIFGYDASEVVGRNVKVLMPAPYHNEHDTYIANYLRTGVAKIIGIGREVEGKRKDGSTFPMDLAVSEFRLGERRFFNGIVRDITERKRSSDLKVLKEAAEAANQAKSQFLANMSHEIRTPLGAVLGFSELIASSEVSPSEREQYAIVIKRNGDLLSSVINDILDLSQVEADRLQIDLQEISLDEILADLSALCNLQAQEKGLKLTVSKDGTVPSIIKTDPLRLKQVLLNIVGNAIKFTQKGRVEVKVRQAPANQLAFEVKDSGLGIDEQQASRLFKPFTQADASIKRKHGGTGLGLALAKRLAQLLGGDVILTESTASLGSTFTITIDPGHPQRTLDGVDREGQVQRQSDKVAPADIRLDGIKVLVVEDSADNQLLIGRMLKMAGATVDQAENGQEALKRLHHEKYDAVLMDIQMPVMDGFEAISILRGEGNKTPIIALTAHALKEERQRCFTAGFTDHLPKPIHRRSLIEAIAHYASGGALKT
jgi:PAS domain S-box-containing protein